MNFLKLFLIAFHFIFILNFLNHLRIDGILLIDENFVVLFFLWRIELLWKVGFVGNFNRNNLFEIALEFLFQDLILPEK